MQKLLSLCIIAKNEEKNLEKCLKSIKSVADEIIVVDTGSTDKTIEIAQKYTDKIFNFEWNDDFSAARNFALDRATGEFIISIDADEYLDNPNALINTIKQAKNDVGGWIVNVVSDYKNQYGQTEKIVSGLLRLFRNDPQIRFKGIIHEQVIDSILNLALKIENSDIVFVHTGYNLEKDLQNQKHRRNLNLLVKALEYDPNNLYLINHIGKTYFALGNKQEATNYFLEVINKSRDVGVYTIEAYNFLSQIYFENQQYDFSIDYASKSLLYAPNQQLPLFIIADSYLAKNEYDKAYFAFKDLIEKFTDIDLKAKVVGQYIIPKERIYFKMGEALTNLGILDDAIKSYEMGLKFNSIDIFCLLGIVKATIKSKQFDLAKQFFEQIKKIHPNNPLLIQFENQYFPNQQIVQPSSEVLSQFIIIIVDDC